MDVSWNSLIFSLTTEYCTKKQASNLICIKKLVNSWMYFYIFSINGYNIYCYKNLIFFHPLAKMNYSEENQVCNK